MSTLVSRVYRAFCRLLADYCSCSSLAGIGNIGNRRYHWSERWFWIACTVTGWVFAVRLILTYVDLFRNDTVSIALESVESRWERTSFPSVGVCEMGYVKSVYSRLEEYMEGLRESESMEYSYDVEDYLLRVIYHNLYNVGAIRSYCELDRSCDECMQCPRDGYWAVSARVRANCSELFGSCYWNDEPFDCCRYFHPIQTSVGLCFLLNSLQTVDKNGKDWLNLEVDKAMPKKELLLNLRQASSAHIMNEEDIPHILLKRLQFSQIAPGTEKTIFLTLQDIANDPLVRSVDTDIRRCRFPDENENGSYRQYSYSVCVTACLKEAQIRMCNCCHHNMLHGEHDSGPACDFEGLLCLDQSQLIAPKTEMLQPWQTEGLACHCYPSCNERQIRIVGRQSEWVDKEERSVRIKLLALPTQRYRRQIVRENVDVVVSVGGILGLFTGASLLSLAEFFYFFTVRFVSYVLAEVHDNRGEDVDDDDDDEPENDSSSSFGEEEPEPEPEQHGASEDNRYTNRYNVYN